MGLGHFGGGVAAARWLARLGAVVTVSDLAEKNTLAEPLGELADLPITSFHLGGHREEDFRRAELVVVNPAVRPDNPMLEIARCSGAQLCSEIELFMRASPAAIIGVTGSNGKSTTAAMISAILQASGRKTWLGGNVGGSLLDSLEQIGEDHWVVLELSSFQLHHLAADAPGPRVAVITGFSPNHLDWHGTLLDYVAAKQRILTLQTAADTAVLAAYDEQLASWRHMVQGRLLPSIDLADVPRLSVPGEHNRRNAACAWAAARAAACGEEATQRGLRAFGGLPQRLEPLMEAAGRMFYNDSAATTPESTIAALRWIATTVDHTNGGLRPRTRPFWLLAGGRNKGSELAELAGEIARHAHGAAFFGSVAEQLHQQVKAVDQRFCCVTRPTMAEALRWCWAQSQPGQAILLSPACASTDQFTNFRQRGEEFARMVRCQNNLFDTNVLQ